jgi:glyoxylase-like metal-dependent hydrolase (beta-lactamase superfamily II)
VPIPDFSTLSGDDIDNARAALDHLGAANAVAIDRANAAEAANAAAASALAEAEDASVAAVSAVQNIFDKVVGEGETITYQGKIVTIEGGKVVLTPSVNL